MAHLFQHLPADVLLHLFAFLPAADRLRVRACCKRFDQLVNHRSLWTDYTACFTFRNGRYNPGFWTSLARRRIQSAVVRGGAQEKHWRQLALTLPSLSTLVVDGGIRECFDHLNKFPKLKCLALRGTTRKKTPDVVQGLSVADPARMTRVSLCEVDFPSHESLLAFLSQFPNLTSFAYHPAGGDLQRTDRVDTFHCVVAGLPKLKHLSWVVNPCPKYFSVPGGTCLGGGEASDDRHPDQTHLTSLELFLHGDSVGLSNHTMMRPLTRLQSLTVVHMDSHQEGCRLLKTWLQCHVHHHLSTLVIDEGPPPREYVRSIPPTVTSLTLRVPQMTSADLAVVASRVPGLLHLQLDPWPVGCHTGLLSKLFPTLQSIKLRVWQIGENNFLDFDGFQSVRRIEVMDAADLQPRISALSLQLQTRTNNRIRILTPTRRRDPRACYHQVH